LIINNNIGNFFNADMASAGIILTGGNTSYVIQRNKFFQTANRVYSTGNIHRAIQVTSGNGIDISENVIGFNNANGSGVYSMGGTVPTRFIGIDFSGTGLGNQIRQNSISNITMGTSSTTSSGAA
jgi:hypothetical protein